MSEVVGFVFWLSIFIFWWFDAKGKEKIRKAELEKRKAEIERIQKLLNAIVRYPELSDGFIVRLANASPYINTIHRSRCNHAREPNVSTLSSSWLGYFRSHKDAVQYSHLLGRGCYSCSFCKPHEHPNVSQTVVS